MHLRSGLFLINVYSFMDRFCDMLIKLSEQLQLTVNNPVLFALDLFKVSLQNVQNIIHNGGVYVHVCVPSYPACLCVSCAATISLRQ